MKNIIEIANILGLNDGDVELYGTTKAKIIKKPIAGKQGKLILVTAISPTASGEGKTTTSIGLADGLNKIGKSVVAVLREPSLGPVFGMKGGATGGGKASMIPSDEINLHFTGDFHAITSANNLLVSLAENYVANQPDADDYTITFKRCLDMNDRGLRGKFDITAASEVMATLCMATDVADLKERLGNLIVGYRKGKPILARDIGAQGAMAALLKEAVKPNLVQTLEGTPTIVHAGPFANIAHGCNSIIATKLGMSLAEYAVTEAGFGADLGAEKFLNIKCRAACVFPNVCVIVATTKAVGEQGIQNLLTHIQNMKDFDLPVIVAINKFPNDTEADIAEIRNACAGTPIVLSDAYAKGGEGAIDLANEVVRLCEGTKPKAKFTYDLNMSIEDKINAIAKNIYKSKGVKFIGKAKEQMAEFTKLGYGKLPICMAKTPYAFTDEDGTNTVRELRLSAGAGFIVAITGAVMTMPGLPKVPAADNINITEQGEITGLR